ncbi:hypothetical protein EVAR_43511_1 [Eumeta japonica]|uniref:Uncharacterized protein n=1 Tax=Eumeta variegata TaxID=151549 RepID=A0A4C1YMN6_EUMVA|nr:hypothetical protein EVAR_43511_1 [Eumeta japonica]
MVGGRFAGEKCSFVGSGRPVTPQRLRRVIRRIREVGNRTTGCEGYVWQRCPPVLARPSDLPLRRPRDTDILTSHSVTFIKDRTNYECSKLLYKDKNKKL